MSGSQSIKDKFLSHVRDNIRGPSAGNIRDVSQLSQREKIELLEYSLYFVQIYGLTMEYVKYKELLEFVFSIADITRQECLEDEDLRWASRVIKDDSSVRVFAREDLQLLIDSVLMIARQKILKVSV